MKIPMRNFFTICMFVTMVGFYTTYLVGAHHNEEDFVSRKELAELLETLRPQQDSLHYKLFKYSGYIVGAGALCGAAYWTLSKLFDVASAADVERTFCAIKQYDEIKTQKTKKLIQHQTHQVTSKVSAQLEKGTKNISAELCKTKQQIAGELQLAKRRQEATRIALIAVQENLERTAQAAELLGGTIARTQKQIVTDGAQLRAHQQQQFEATLRRIDLLTAAVAHSAISVQHLDAVQRRALVARRNTTVQ